MRIGFGCTLYARGLASQHLDGIGYYTNELATRLSAIDDIQPLVFGPSDISQLYGQPVMQLPRFAQCSMITALTGRSFAGTNTLRQRVDLVHAPDHQIPRFKGIPVLATLMDAIPLSNPEWASSRLRTLKNILWKKTATWADHIITISDYSKSEIINHFHIDERKISVVPLGVDERFYQAPHLSDIQRVRAAYHVPEHYFLFVGTLQPRKNLSRVIQAHQSLPMAMRQAFPLLIVGRAGWGCKDLLDQIRRMPESEPVRWLGGVDDTTKRVLLQQATALVFVSLSEGFGLPVLEAFATSTPVIAANTSAVPEVAGQAALMVDPTRIDEIAHAMQQITDNQTLAAQLKHQGLQRAQAFTWSVCAEKTRTLYQRMIR